jgi:large subunit ribosomal protein L22e
LHDRIKVGGKTNNLSGVVTIHRDGTQITVTSQQPMSKGYLKYLTKKYLKKSYLRDYFRVISSGKHAYELRYFKTYDRKGATAAEGEEAEEA